MKTKILINGRCYDAEISDKTIKQMAAELEQKKHTGFEHPGFDKVIYHIDGGQYTANERETLKPDEFSDKQICDNWARKRDIERRLYEAAAVLNKKPLDKQDIYARKYFIIFWDVYDEELRTKFLCTPLITTVYFESEEVAKEAIDIVGKDDLIWLLRDFQPYVGAYKEAKE